MVVVVLLGWNVHGIDLRTPREAPMVVVVLYALIDLLYARVVVLVRVSLVRFPKTHPKAECWTDRLGLARFPKTHPKAQCWMDWQE